MWYRHGDVRHGTGMEVVRCGIGRVGYDKNGWSLYCSSRIAWSTMHSRSFIIIIDVIALKIGTGGHQIELLASSIDLEDRS